MTAACTAAVLLYLRTVTGAEAASATTWMSRPGRAAARPQIICRASTSRDAGARVMSLCTRRAATGSATGRDTNGRAHDRGDHPVVSQADLPRALRRAVMKPADRVHLLAGTPEQGVIDRDQHRLTLGDQQRHDQTGQQRGHLAGLPGRRGEEPVSPVVAPRPR